MGGLGDHPAAQDTDSHRVRGCLHSFSNIVSLSQITQKVIFPMDRSKVGVVDFARVCTPRDVDIIVTDSANEDLSRICREHEIKLEEASI